MKKIEWCKKRKRGIELIEPNVDLKKGYIKKAEAALKTSRTVESFDWQITAAYYCIYYSIYSIMMQIGIKCEIHSCTLEFAKEFLNKHFTKEDFELFSSAFEARQDHQYYVNKEVNKDTRDFILKRTPEIFIKCKDIYLKTEEINSIRNKIKK